MHALLRRGFGTSVPFITCLNCSHLEVSNKIPSLQ